MERILSRPEAIEILREALLTEVAETNHTICSVAAQRGIFCRGYRRFDDQQLRLAFWWIDAAAPGLSRREFESHVDVWQKCRQTETENPLTCDLQQQERLSCHGWDDFSNQELARYCRDVAGVDVIVMD